MNLSQNNCSQNSYSLKRPITKSGDKALYAKILELVYSDTSKEWNRIELLNQALGRNYPLNARGQSCYIFSAFSSADLMQYNSSTRKWSAGKNLKSYMTHYGLGNDSYLPLYGKEIVTPDFTEMKNMIHEANRAIIEAVCIPSTKLEDIKVESASATDIYANKVGQELKDAEWKEFARLATRFGFVLPGVN